MRNVQQIALRVGGTEGVIEPTRAGNFDHDHPPTTAKADTGALV